MNKDIRGHTAAGSVIKATQVGGGGAESQGGKGHRDLRSRSAQGLETAECLPGICQALGSTSSMVEAAERLKAHGKRGNGGMGWRKLPQGELGAIL